MALTIRKRTWQDEVKMILEKEKENETINAMLSLVYEHTHDLQLVLDLKEKLIY